MKKWGSYMTSEDTAYIYRIKINSMYGWFTSKRSPDNFEQIIKEKSNRIQNIKQKQTAIQRALISLEDFSKISYWVLSTVPATDMTRQNLEIIKDLVKFSPDSVFEQRITNLYFCGVNVNGTVNLNNLKSLMRRYPQVDFGWPSNPDLYHKMMDSQSTNPYSQLRAKILSYCYNDSNGDLEWLYPDSPQYNSNYNQAFKWLNQNAKSISKWYYDEPSKTTGIIWHFTDINNMANILSFKEIVSKNHGQEQAVIENNNAAHIVNDRFTKPWVHDYARFYLRPKTPTQYRNEGIYQYHGEHPNYAQLPKSLTNSLQNSFWTDGQPAHLPVPVFIGFSLSKFLEKGGHLTKGSLAGERVSDSPDEMLDDNFIFLRDHVEEIYSENYAANYLKHTEFIFPQKMDFDSRDILRIVVRSEAEKLVLLTMLAEHDSMLFSDEKHHIKPEKFVDRIIVDPSFFYFNASSVQMYNKPASLDHNQYHLYLQPPVEPSNLQIIKNNYGFTKEIDANKRLKQGVIVPKLTQITLKVRDINNNVKLIARFHDPDWILSINKWIPSKWKRKINAARNRTLKNRYYSVLYYHHQYVKLWREEGSNQWFFYENNQPENILKEEDQKILRKIEDSCSVTLLN